MRKWLLLCTALIALGFLGRVGDGAAPLANRLSVPRPAHSISPPSALPGTDPIPGLEAVLLADGLDRPTATVAIDEHRLLVAEKAGTIRLVEDGRVRDEPFLDLADVVPDRQTERGLLALALHPGFAATGQFYVHLTDTNGDSRLIEYRAADAVGADPASARLILAVDQPGQFHNGGMIQFGPDGYLYVAVGDGNFGEARHNAASANNLLGSILRIDVDATDPYAVPTDNPFVGTDGAAEVWLTGLRNPWRFWIDPTTRQIVIGDVGQFRWEELTVLPLEAGGLDLGWPRLEGEECYESDTCSTAGIAMPDIVYSHSVGCAVVAGPVYRGSLVPELEGMIIYADYCSGVVRAFAMFDGHVLRHLDLVAGGSYGPILSLALDGADEILILTERGEIRRLQPAP